MNLNRYSAPAARTIDASRTAPGALLFGATLVVVLAVLWWLDFPRGVLSPWVSSHFPWPAHASVALTWAALFVDRLLIESAVCLPAAMLLALALPSWAVLLSTLLACEEAACTALEVLNAPSPKQRAYLLLAMGLHALLLIGGAAMWRDRWRPRRIAVLAGTRRPVTSE